MKIRLLTISKENDLHTKSLLNDYSTRLRHYTSFEIINIKPQKYSGIDEQKKAEANQLLKKISSEETLLLLDERGKELTSTGLADFIETKMNTGVKAMWFAIGGAYGFDEAIYKRSNHSISLSKMTLPHQLASVILVEQLYRAFTIIRGEGYHHG